MDRLRAPFPWFGGKSRVAHLVWAAFGDTANYVEPFAGSLAVLLGRPTKPRIETCNDVDAYLCNFWRAVQRNPAKVAKWADWPVSEPDLHARHRWLVSRQDFVRRMKRDPRYFDAKIAGWWAWGICQWIGSGWCHAGTLPNNSTPSREQRRPHLTSSDGLLGAVEWEGRGHAGRAARGIHTAEYEQRPDLSGERGLNARRMRQLDEASEWEKRPVLGRGSRGVVVNNEKRPHLWRGGRGVHSDAAADVTEQLPCLSGDSGAAGRWIHASGKMSKQDRGTDSRLQPMRTEAIYEWMEQLCHRLRRVRVCCGDWQRVLGPSSTEKIGLTGVFLDPPYSAEADRDPSIYNHDDLQVAHAVREWALENGDNRKLRIAYCSYGEEPCPPGWQRIKWKAPGGYAAAAGNHENASRETIDFSPACLRIDGPAQLHLFSEAAR